MVKNPLIIAANGIERLPGMPNITGPSIETIERQQRLRDMVGRMILVGDFAREQSIRRINKSAHETVKILRNSEISSGDGAIFTLMTPSSGPTPDSLKTTREVLTDYFDEDQEGPITWSDRPARIEVRDNPNDKKPFVRAYEAIDKTIYPLWRREKSKPEFAGRNPDTTIVLIANPEFALDALGLVYSAHDLSGGRFLGLNRVGPRTRDNTWIPHFYERPVRELKRFSSRHTEPKDPRKRLMKSGVTKLLDIPPS